MESLKARRAAVLYDVASDYNKGIAEFFKATFEQNGGKVVAFETYTTNDRDFSAQLTKIKKAEPDVVFLPNYYGEETGHQGALPRKRLLGEPGADQAVRQ